MICMAMGWADDGSKEPGFKDVSNRYWAYSYIKTAKSHKMLSGYADGSFNPSKEITRAEIAKMLAEAIGLVGNKTGKASFSDIGDHWAQRYIAECSDSGIINGYPGNKFKPDATATRAEAAKMITQALKL
jgi:hypothetical protein